MDDHNNNNNNNNNDSQFNQRHEARRTTTTNWAIGGDNRDNKTDSSGESSGSRDGRSRNNEEESPLQCFLGALNRKKPLDCRTDTNLNRCLNLTDLTALGVGSTLGLGLYVLTGQAASHKAGPAVVISFAMAAVASAFSALCYAEFAGRVPRAGSAYAYSYICVGEFVAFVIGWNLVLEYAIGTSSVARGFSAYLQRVYNNIMQLEPAATSAAASSSVLAAANLTAYPALHNLTATATATSAPSAAWLESALEYLARYFDPVSLVVVLIATLCIILGVKNSTGITVGLTGLNLLVVGFMVMSSARVVVSGLGFKNWRLSKAEVPEKFGEGGFMPYGWSGLLAGSGSCFFGFIGFDTIASSAEEAKSPKRNVPLAILLSLLISTLAYVAVAVVQTLLWPYYDQDSDTILPHIFSQLQMPITYWVVLLGAIAGLSSSSLAGMYPLPRILYSMASDRLIYGYLDHISRRLKLPMRAIISGSVAVAALSCLLDLEDLADMVSIGTLFAYTLVSVSVLILRYENRKDAVNDSTLLNNNHHSMNINNLSLTDMVHDPSLKQQQPGKLATNKSATLSNKLDKSGFNSWLSKSSSGDEDSAGGNEFEREAGAKRRYSLLDLLTNWKSDDLDQLKSREPNDESSRQSKILISVIVILCTLLNVIAVIFSRIQDVSGSGSYSALGAGNNQLINPMTLLSTSGSIVLLLLALTMLMLSRLPTSSMPKDTFTVPWVPLIPTLSVLVNILLMINLSYLTWVRFTVWMAIGLFIYFTYGIWNSVGYLLSTTGEHQRH